MLNKNQKYTIANRIIHFSFKYSIKPDYSINLYDLLKREDLLKDYNDFILKIRGAINE